MYVSIRKSKKRHAAVRVVFIFVAVVGGDSGCGVVFDVDVCLQVMIVLLAVLLSFLSISVVW